jgi:hypothetical protein
MSSQGDNKLKTKARAWMEDRGYNPITIATLVDEFAAFAASSLAEVSQQLEQAKKACDLLGEDLESAEARLAVCEKALRKAHGCATIREDGTCDGCFVSEALAVLHPEAHYIAIADETLNGDPSCHVCGAIMTKVEQVWKCESCGATNPEPVKEGQ